MVFSSKKTWSLQSILLLIAAASLLVTSHGAAQATPVRGEQEKPTCIGPFTCDGAINLCVAGAGERVVGTFTFSDSGYSVQSDGRGAYHHGEDRAVAVASVAVVLAWRRPPADSSGARYFSIDLRNPVATDIGRPVGVISDQYAEIAAQWYAEAGPPDSLGRRRRIQHMVSEIPVGTTVPARQVGIGIHIDGRYHILQLGPQPVGHCFAEGTTIYGDGTTQASITRESETRWLVEAPPGSIGRLFDTFHTNRFAVNKGLYYVSFKYVVEKSGQ